MERNIFKNIYDIPCLVDCIKVIKKLDIQLDLTLFDTYFSSIRMLLIRKKCAKKVFFLKIVKQKYH